jgi:hypothetical protein
MTYKEAEIQKIYQSFKVKPMKPPFFIPGTDLVKQEVH